MNLQTTDFVPTKVCQNLKQQNQPLQCTSKIYSCEKSVQTILQISFLSIFQEKMRKRKVTSPYFHNV